MNSFKRFRAPCQLGSMSESSTASEGLHSVRETGEQSAISRFLEELRADIRNRCAIWAYGSLIELVEKSVRMKARLLEEAKLLKSTQAKMTKGAELFWWSQQV